MEVRLVRVDSSQYALRLGDRTLRFEAGELLGSLGPRTGPQRGQDALRSRHAVLPLMDSTGVQAGELLVWHVLEATDSTGTYLQRFEGLVLLRQ